VIYAIFVSRLLQILVQTVQHLLQLRPLAIILARIQAVQFHGVRKQPVVNIEVLWYRWRAIP